MHGRVALLIVCALALVVAGCVGIDDESGPPNGSDGPANESADGGPPVASEAFEASLEPIDCPDILVVAELPREELQPLVPDGYVLGDSQDAFLGLSPAADQQQHAGTGLYGALMLFIQRCKSEVPFAEGYSSLFVESPEHSMDLPETGLNFVVLEHAVESEWLAEASQRTGWDLDGSGAAHVERTLSETDRSASVSWSNATVDLASVEATAAPAQPPAEYDVIARVWQDISQGLVIYDHAAAGNAPPADEFTCESSPDTQFANITGRTDCDGSDGPERFSSYILEGHDPSLTVSFFPDS